MSANKDCELPAADSCALAEGEGGGERGRGCLLKYFFVTG